MGRKIRSETASKWNLVHNFGFLRNRLPKVQYLTASQITSLRPQWTEENKNLYQIAHKNEESIKKLQKSEQERVYKDKNKDIWGDHA